jgi:hypothetical protein
MMLGGSLSPAWDTPHEVVSRERKEDETMTARSIRNYSIAVIEVGSVAALISGASSEIIPNAVEVFCLIALVIASRFGIRS